MRRIRIRELLLVVALVALGLGWWRDRATLAARLAVAEDAALKADFQHAGTAAMLDQVTRMTSAEAARRKQAEVRLAECEASKSDD